MRKVCISKDGRCCHADILVGHFVLVADMNPLATFVFRGAAGTVQQEIVKKDIDCIIAKVDRYGTVVGGACPRRS